MSTRLPNIVTTSCALVSAEITLVSRPKLWRQWSIHHWWLLSDISCSHLYSTITIQWPQILPTLQYRECKVSINVKHLSWVQILIWHPFMCHLERGNWSSLGKGRFFTLWNSDSGHCLWYVATSVSTCKVHGNRVACCMLTDAQSSLHMIEYTLTTTLDGIYIQYGRVLCTVLTTCMCISCHSVPWFFAQLCSSPCAPWSCG